MEIWIRTGYWRVTKELSIVCDNGIMVVFKKPLNLLEAPGNILKHLGSTDIFTLSPAPPATNSGFTQDP